MYFKFRKSIIPNHFYASNADNRSEIINIVDKGNPQKIVNYPRFIWTAKRNEEVIGTGRWSTFDGATRQAKKALGYNA